MPSRPVRHHRRDILPHEKPVQVKNGNNGHRRKSGTGRHSFGQACHCPDNKALPLFSDRFHWHKKPCPSSPAVSSPIRREPSGNPSPALLPRQRPIHPAPANTAMKNRERNKAEQKPDASDSLQASNPLYPARRKHRPLHKGHLPFAPSDNRVPTYDTTSP